MFYLADLEITISFFDITEENSWEGYQMSRRIHKLTLSSNYKPATLCLLDDSICAVFDAVFKATIKSYAMKTRLKNAIKTQNAIKAR